jgi:uncharacterized protein YkwD
MLAAVALAITAAIAANSATTLERRVLDLVNVERAKAHLPALKPDDRLSAIARAHSRDMARRHFFGHVNPDGEDPTTRGRRAGYECRKSLGDRIRTGLAENLYEASGTARKDIEHASVAGWMKSPPHRANMLEKTYTSTGVGVAVEGDAVFITQLFC